jgi:aminopeptidase N
MNRRRIARAVGIVATCVAMVAPVAPAHAAFLPGSPGLGDPFFPLAGNGGYDVRHYALTLSYDPATRRLDGVAVITAQAAQDLSRFDLDLRGFDIPSVTVDGRRASFVRDGQELIITPAQGVKSGSTFTIDVAYAGQPQIVTDPDQSIEGWVPTDDGAFVVGEPQGSPAWYPVNDNPRDKASFDFTVTVPAGITVMANGVLVSSTTSGGKTTWAWRENDRMAPYLATVTLGRFDVTISKLGDGTPSYVAVDPRLARGQILSKLPEIIDFYRSIYGPYPFDAVGAIVDSAKVVGYSLETQTKPVFQTYQMRRRSPTSFRISGTATRSP